MAGRTLTGPKAEVHPNQETATKQMLVEMGRAPAETLTEPVSKPADTPEQPKKPSTHPEGLILFSKVKEARKAILAEAERICGLYMQSIEAALADGQFDVAQQGLQWLMEHMPADEDGTKLIDQSIDKPKADSGKGSGPQINIGVQLGGMTAAPKSLPAHIIDAEVKDE
jgi:hypothetical protein